MPEIGGPAVQLAIQPGGPLRLPADSDAKRSAPVDATF